MRGQLEAERKGNGDGGGGRVTPKFQEAPRVEGREGRLRRGRFAEGGEQGGPQLYVCQPPWQRTRLHLRER